MKQQLDAKGYLILNEGYEEKERAAIASVIDAATATGAAFRRSRDLFAIRRVLMEVPELLPLVFTPRLKELIAAYTDEEYFISKSIYFDKPPGSNWFVAYHQDLTIAVVEKADVAGFGHWSRKDDHFTVQPPVSMLEHNLTLRIHLDDTDESNGALRVIPGSHRKGICRPETIDWSAEHEDSCTVPAGGIMLMKPLLLHASSRSTANTRRRVLHIELSKAVLPLPLRWAERQRIP